MSPPDINVCFAISTEADASTLSSGFAHEERCRERNPGLGAGKIRVRCILTYNRRQ
jgi:hypothetical protein